jgi:multiple sugar transport system substrate-binding protein
MVDYTTGKAVISGKWNEVFKTLMSVYEIPNNKMAKLQPSGYNYFVKNQNLAMLWDFNYFSKMKDLTGLDWDVVQLPSFPDKPNTNIMADPHFLAHSKTTKYPDQTMRVLEVLLSDEVQHMMSKAGKPSVLKDESFRKEFASDLFTDKNMQGALKSAPAKPIKPHENNELVRKEIDAAFLEVYGGKKDINTAIRDAEERANQKIAEKNSQ